MIDIVRYERQAHAHAGDEELAQWWLQNDLVNSVTIYRVDGLPANPITMTQTPDGVMGDMAASVPVGEVPAEIREQLVRDLENREAAIAKLQEKATVAKNIAGRLFQFVPGRVPSDDDVKKLDDFLYDCREAPEQEMRILCVWCGNGAIAGLTACLERDRRATVYAVTPLIAEFHEDNVSEWVDSGYLKMIVGHPELVANQMGEEDEIDAVVFGDDAPEDPGQQTRDLNAWQLHVKDKSSKRLFVVDWKCNA